MRNRKSGCGGSVLSEGSFLGRNCGGWKNCIAVSCYQQRTMSCHGSVSLYNGAEKTQCAYSVCLQQVSTTFWLAARRTWLCYTVVTPEGTKKCLKNFGAALKNKEPSMAASITNPICKSLSGNVQRCQGQGQHDIGPWAAEMSTRLEVNDGSGSHQKTSDQTSNSGRSHFTRFPSQRWLRLLSRQTKSRSAWWTLAAMGRTTRWLQGLGIWGQAQRPAINSGKLGRWRGQTPPVPKVASVVQRRHIWDDRCCWWANHGSPHLQRRRDPPDDCRASRRPNGSNLETPQMSPWTQEGKSIIVQSSPKTELSSTFVPLIHTVVISRDNFV